MGCIWVTKASISGAVREWVISRAVMCRLVGGIVQRAWVMCVSNCLLLHTESCMYVMVDDTYKVLPQAVSPGLQQS